MGIVDVVKVIALWVLVLFAFWVTYNLGYADGARSENSKLRSVSCFSIQRGEHGELFCNIPMQAEDDKLNLYEEKQ